MDFEEWQAQAENYFFKEKYREAIDLYEQCVESNPDEVSNYWKLGLALLLAGEDLDAQACWLSALVEGTSEEIEAKTKELIQLLETEGRQRLESGKYEQAEKIFLQIIEQDPNNDVVYKNLGNAAFNQGKLEEAETYYKQGLSLSPNDAITYYYLAIVLHQQDKLEDAIACYRQFLSVNPNSSEALNNLGNAFQRQGNFEEAIACYQKSLTLDANDALTYNNLGSAFKAIGKLEEALTCFQQGLILEPNNAEAHNNIALFYEEQRQYEKAISYYDRTIEIEPDYVNARWNRSLMLLRSGNFQSGFVEYEWRWRREQTPPRSLPKPVWDGSNLEGKTILLQAEQGMGDMIQFIRYVPLLVQRGGRVIVECHPPLVRLLAGVAGVEKVLAIGETLPEFDVYIPLLSLPRIFGTTLETIPVSVPYIYPVESVSFKLDRSDKSRLKVGLVWAGNPAHQDDRKRSCSLSHFLPLLNIPDVAFYSLQKGPKSAEITEICSQLSLDDLSSQLDDFAVTAAVVVQLDLVITVDTAVAHLAGALGKLVWVLLNYNPDWRWMIAREDSPWYPTMRLFRQNRSGNWEEVLERVAKELKQLLI